MTDIYSEANPPQMEWIQNGMPNYQNWIYGSPEDIQADWSGHTCGCINKGRVSIRPSLIPCSFYEIISSE